MGHYKVRTKGDLVIHGKKQSRIIPGTITVTNGVIAIESNFTVPLTDHDITIPKNRRSENCHRDYREVEV